MPSKIRVPQFHRIQITDNLFGHYVELVAGKMIPYQWDVLNGRGEYVKSHCVDNFKIAAGEQSGKHKGVVFGDTDAYKWLEAVAFCAMNGRTEYIPVADELIRLIGKAQQPDGYLNTYYTLVEPNQRWKNLREGHELYSAGHLFEAFSQSKHPAEAMEFIKWYMKEENSWDSLIATGIWMPILEKYYTDEALTNSWIDNENFPEHEECVGALVNYAMDSAQSTCWYYVPHTNEFIELLRGVLGDVWTGDTTAESALNDNYDALNAIFLGE